MKVVGLTGGIGSGKTTVAGFFRELGVPVYIADLAGRKLLETSPKIKKAILELFGPDSYKGNKPDRKFIAAKVFNDPERLKALNSIIHPAVARDFEKWKSQKEAPYVIYEAAILFEAGGYKKCDVSILVTAPKEERIRRIKERDQSTEEEIIARMENQWSDEEKSELADFTIKNKNLSETKEQVKALHHIILKSGKN